MSVSHDLLIAAAWSALLAAGLTGAALIHRLGLATTYTRDLLHVGAGVWVIGWPAWQSPALPIAITAATALAIAALPFARHRSRAAARLHAAVTGGDERWGGLVLYTAAYALLTAVGLAGARPLPAAAALLALSLGDGVGGAFGRRFGRVHYRAPGGKQKSLEGSAMVAVMATAGAALAAAALAAPLPLALAALAGAVAALAEALAPRGTDNLVVPAAVWLTLTALV